jgi:hypothetical protein
MIGKLAHIGVLISLFQIDGTAPVLQNISPTFGPVAGNTLVTLNGTGFQSGATVTFDGIAATNVTFVDSTRLTARTPAHPAFGLVDVTVTNPDTQFSTLAASYRYRSPAAPNLTTVAPNSGTILGNRVLALTGTSFAAGATVDFGGVPAAATVNSATSITVTTPPGGSVGPVDVTVTNPNGEPSVPGEDVYLFAGDHRQHLAQPRRDRGRDSVHVDWDRHRAWHCSLF